MSFTHNIIRYSDAMNFSVVRRERKNEQRLRGQRGSMTEQLAAERLERPCALPRLSPASVLEPKSWTRA